MDIQFNKTPLVTIGIPNFNYAHYIEEALDSVAMQTYKNIELIIVDDCSTDNSISVIEKWIKNYSGNFTINLIKNKTNLGLTKTCNVILKNASGKYYQTLDADDRLAEDKINRQIQVLNKNPEAAFIYGNVWVMDENGKVAAEDYLKRINYDETGMPEGNIFTQLFTFNFVPLPSVLINTKFARDAGGYDNSLQVQDYYLSLKLSKKHPVIYQPLKLAYYRVHSNSMSNNPQSNLNSIESVLKIKYAYLKEVEKPVQAIIKRNIHFSTPLFYEFKHKNAGLWLKRNLILTPGIKSVVYYVAFKIGIPFSFFSALKRGIAKN